MNGVAIMACSSHLDHLVLVSSASGRRHQPTMTVSGAAKYSLNSICIIFAIYLDIVYISRCIKERIYVEVLKRSTI
jgi:hypothetical protein